MMIAYENSCIRRVIPLNNELFEILPGLAILERFICGQPSSARERVTA